MLPTRASRTGRKYALAVLAGTVVLAGCAGENLFTGFVGAGSGGLTVDITAPTEGFTLANGASVQINAEVTAANGLVAADYQGVYTDGGGAAFIAETETFASVPFASLNQTLDAVVGQISGDVWVIVTVTDNQGGAKADTVKVKVN